jgi:predicted PurR-regulated permease PerM
MLKARNFFEIAKFGLPKHCSRSGRDDLVSHRSIVNVIFSSLLKILTLIGNFDRIKVILTPIMTFYLLKDFRKFKDYIKTI